MNTSTKKILKKIIGFMLQGAVLSSYFIALELIFHFMQELEVSQRIMYPILFSVPL